MLILYECIKKCINLVRRGRGHFNPYFPGNEMSIKSGNHVKRIPLRIKGRTLRNCILLRRTYYRYQNSNLHQSLLKLKARRQGDIYIK